jgi:phospholipid N-methyltransferase
MNIKDVKKNWHNLDNNNYYENVSPEEFKKFAQIGGFDDNCDIELIYPFIKNTQTLIEIGAGYGRVVNALLSRNYPGKIAALERSNNFFNYLKRLYDKKADLIHGDVALLAQHDTYDAVLYMWSNLSEWPKNEQSKLISALCTWVKPGGLLILETFDASQIPLNATGSDGQTYHYESDHGVVHGYNATITEIDTYIKQSNLLLKERLNYVTRTDRKRIIHVLEKS